MAVLGQGEKPVVRPYYSHMLFEDVAVWTRFLEAGHAEVLEVWYDLHCGEPVAVPPGLPGYMEKVALAVTRKRIDVVCRVEGGFWVVEVKPFGNAVALGQVLNYRGLFEREFEVRGYIWGVVVCDRVDRDVVADFEHHGVLVFEVG